MGENTPVYSIQRTYIIKPVSKSDKRIFTCDERIDIPTIEPLSNVQPVSLEGQALTVTPCIELAGEFLSEFNLTFETNEGVTVLPVKIPRGDGRNIENPYTHFRYVLVLPRGATGVKSCKLIHKATGKEVQHNLAFGVMPPPYNYDNALFGYLIDNTVKNANGISDLLMFIQYGNIKKNTTRTVELPKGAVHQTMDVSPNESTFYVKFEYPQSEEPTIHNPKIAVTSDFGTSTTYNLSLNKTYNIVAIDVLSGMITAYDEHSMEIIQQFMLDYLGNGLQKLRFSNFDDIATPTLTVISKECKLGV